MFKRPVLCAILFVINKAMLSAEHLELSQDYAAAVKWSLKQSHYLSSLANLNLGIQGGGVWLTRVVVVGGRVWLTIQLSPGLSCTVCSK